MKVAVIGCGVISTAYLSNLTGRFKAIRAVACYDHHPEKAAAQAERFGIASLSWEEILANPEIEMIINLTPPAAHYAVIKEALEHGKHVFSEKTMTVSLEEARDLVALADAKGLRLGVAPDTFLCGGVQTARYAMEHDLIGTIRSATIAVNRNIGVYADMLPFLERPGGSMAFDYGVYHLTALASFMGPATRVTAFSHLSATQRTRMRLDQPHFGETVNLTEDDVVAGVIEFASGALVTVNFTGSSLINEQPYFTVFGSKGVMSMGDPNIPNGEVRIRKPQQEWFTLPFTHGFLDESRGVGAAEMVWAIRAGRAHRASKEMSLNVLEMVHGLTISAHSGAPYEMTTTFTPAPALPEGYLPNAAAPAWGPSEESALV
jgi:predicted dehydrogenase